MVAITSMSRKKVIFVTISSALLILLIGGALFGQVTQKNNVYRYLSIFSEVFDLVRSNYVEQVSSDHLMDGAFSGVSTHEDCAVLADSAEVVRCHGRHLLHAH